jgi:hypothetical protein
MEIETRLKSRLSTDFHSTYVILYFLLGLKTLLPYIFDSSLMSV